MRSGVNKGGRVGFALVALAFAAGTGCSGEGPTGDDVTGPDSDVGVVQGELANAGSCPSGYQVVVGTAGNDVIDVSVTPNAYGVDPTQPTCVIGLAGNDVITTGSAKDWVAGGLGNDTIRGGDGDDYLNGEPGVDTIYGEGGNDKLYGDDDADTIWGGTGSDTINGGRADDVIHGEDGGDVLQGVDGNDTIYGEGGNDSIDCGSGDDTASGGPGDDTIYGVQGADVLQGDDGNDKLYGGTEADTLEGGDGSDRLQGDDGPDHLWGDFVDNAASPVGSAADTLFGNAGNDDLHGGPGNDVLWGAQDDDVMDGDDGDDRLIGGLGANSISGGAGNDLSLGNGSDTASGGDGNDVLAVSGASSGDLGTDACTGTSCELAEPPSFCTTAADCGVGRRCAIEVGICIYCQSDSECTGGAQCIPTLGCTSKEVNCSDGLDDDGDGAIDCADSDCDQKPNCQQGVRYFGNGGTWHQCIANSNGETKCWGRNNCGQLGYFAPDHATTQSSTNATIIVNTLAAPPREVHGGNQHTCALLTDGTVQCWGGNATGELGIGTIANTCSISPVAVTGLSGVTQLASGGRFSCAVVSGGVMCWGQNSYGQLGNGSQANSGTPVAVQGLSGTVVEVQAGVQHACARLTSGLVQCWGRNHMGQLGVTGPAFSTTAVAVSGLPAVEQIGAGAEFTCGRFASGRVQCFGANYVGQLGIGSTDGSAHPTPTNVSNVTDARDLALGWYHACVVRAQSQGLKCWGKNSDGQLGVGSTSAAISTPALILLYDGTNLGMGASFSCVRRRTGGVACWGDNQYGQIGDGTTTDRLSPFDVAGVP